MQSWFHFRLGFSLIGFIFLLCLFVPNILFALREPAWQVQIAETEPAALLLPERIGQVLTVALVLLNKDLRLPSVRTPQAWWLIAAAVLMTLYLAAWIRFFAGGRQQADFYGSFLGIPLPLAVLPVAAAVLLGVYARSFWLILAAVILGFGHIGLHALHCRALRSGGLQ